MSPALAASQYANSELWKARDTLFRRNMSEADAEWNMVLVESRPPTRAILLLKAVLAELQLLEGHE
jgi:hypothetical protein